MKRMTELIAFFIIVGMCGCDDSWHTDVETCICAAVPEVRAVEGDGAPVGPRRAEPSPAGVFSVAVSEEPASDMDAGRLRISGDQQGKTDAPSRAGRGDGTRKVPVAACIDINTADEAHLMKLPGIGRVRARALIERRRQHPFGSPESVMRVKGIGPKIYKKMAPGMCAF